MFDCLFESDIHQALKMRAVSAHLSVSELSDEAVRLLMREDQEGLAAVSERANEPEISYEVRLNDLKSHSQL
ncbi:MAG: CopG family transcriptional regulator [Colwellia sp.]